MPDTVFGYQAFSADLSAPVLGRMAESGARFVRVPVGWRWIEPASTVPPTYGWDGLDRALTRLDDVGFTTIGVVYEHPAWAASRMCGPIDRVPLSRYGAFVGALVERYDGDGSADAPGSPIVRHWQVGNEPDFDVGQAGGEGDYGSCFGGRPADYGAYLRTAYAAAKSASSSAVVLFGGVAYDRFYNKSGYTPTGPFDHDFVGDVIGWLWTNHRYERGWPFFDWMAMHVYNDYRNAWDGTPPYDQELLGKVAHLRANQLLRTGQFDLRSRPVALTEVGISSMPSDAGTERTEDLQADYPGQVLARSIAAGAAAVTWFSVEDHKTGVCTDPYAWLGTGVLRSMGVFEAGQRCGGDNPIADYRVAEDHEPKPAHTAADVAVGELAGVTYDGQVPPSLTGSVQLEAHRFRRPDGVYVVAAFTDHGERLGRRGYAPLQRTMSFGPAVLPGWTGRALVVDHLGRQTHLSGSSVTVTVTQHPVYVRPE